MGVHEHLMMGVPVTPRFNSVHVMCCNVSTHPHILEINIIVFSILSSIVPLGHKWVEYGSSRTFGSHFVLAKWISSTDRIYRSDHVYKLRWNLFIATLTQ